ncbi:MAG TPA: hypothetical protein ENJ09_06550 [Planctomycetes bacterium]|nr:hypothetical protein [Planctomycetota bacterium]
MNMQGLLIHLQSWVQAELAAQRDLCVCLGALTDAVMGADNECLQTAAKELELRLEAGTGREIRRQDLMARFAKVCGVPADSLSVTSLIERGRSEGIAVEALSALRDELREVALDVRSRARRLMVLARHHGGVLEELLGILGCGGDGAGSKDSGVLVDARG